MHLLDHEIVIKPSKVHYCTAYSTERIYVLLQQKTETSTSTVCVRVSLTSVWILEDNEELVRSLRGDENGECFWLYYMLICILL